MVRVFCDRPEEGMAAQKMRKVCPDFCSLKQLFRRKRE
jgi:hypothetical protein